MASENQEHLVRVFPVELWGLILSNVQIPADYLNITRASAYFEAHLVRRRVHIFFPEVLKHLGIINPEAIQIDQDSILEVLPLRQVCVAWKRGVDQILQRRQLYEIYPMINPVQQLNVEAEDDNGFEKFKTLKGFLEFEEHFNATHLQAKSNPFICRAVEMHKMKEEPTQEYLNGCLEFAKNYGKHIWYFGLHVYIEDPTENIKSYTQELQQILEQVPNTKVLLFGGAKLERELLRRLENEITELEYPTLKHLLYLDLGQELPMPVIRKIIDNNQHVEAVAPHDSITMMNFYMQEMPNLKRCAYGFRCWNFETLERIQPKGRLEKLRLHVNAGIIPTTRVFTTLETKFSDTLTHLDISCDDENLEIVGTLRLANLKVLHLRLFFTVLFDFLLPLSGTLEELTLSLMDNKLNLNSEEGKELMDLVKKTENVIKLYGFIQQPECSNIWSIFSKLKTLNIYSFAGQGACTRQKWKEATKERKNHDEFGGKNIPQRCCSGNCFQ